MAAAALSDCAEVDTSRAFRSVKEAVAVFGERILAREAAQFRPNATAHGDRLNIREKNRRPKTFTIAAPSAKLEVSDGVPASGILNRESHSKASASYRESHSKASAPDLLPSPMTSRAAPDDVPMYLVPSSPPFFASSPSLANDEFDEQELNKDADLMVMSSIRKLEDEAARTRQDVAQLKKRIAEMELSMATLNAKLHRALSKLAHMEADKAAAERAAIERGGRGHGGDMALALWAERRGPSGGGGRPPLGHLMRFGGDANGEEAPLVAGGGQMEMARPPARRKVQKQKPIVPLVFPLIGGALFSKKKRMKDKESVYMKELYNLLRLT
ncbi:hypothetical protein EJB05_02659, partial [Eragrostis curvula]